MLAPPRGENLTELFASAQATDGPASNLEDLIGTLLASRPTWMRDGLCAEYPEVTFFPERGEDVEPAKRVCSRCLVLPECRSWAMDQDASLAGVWGGTTAPQRKRMRAARAPSTAA